MLDFARSQKIYICLLAVLPALVFWRARTGSSYGDIQQRSLQTPRAEALGNTCFNVTGTPELRRSQCENQTEFLSSEDWYQKWTDSTLPGFRYFEDPGVIYCAIAKNACTEYKRLMLRTSGDPEWTLPLIKLHFRYRKRPTLDQEPNPAALLLDPAVPKFAITRNPITRTLSAFIDKHEIFQMAKDGSPESFREWAKKQFRSEHASHAYGATCSMNVHWQPQVCRCGFLHAPLLFTLLKMEDEEAAINFVYEVFPNRSLVDGWGPRNVSWRSHFLPEEMASHAKHSSEKFLEFYDLKTFDLIAKRFKPDIDTLDYSSEVAEMRRKLVAHVESSSSQDDVSGLDQREEELKEEPTSGL